jgi:DNA-binding transcriptional LysR family regulator
LNDDEAIWQSVLGGLGISLLPTFIVGEDLQSGNLQPALTQYVASERNLHALYLPNRHLSAKVRVFIDFLVARFLPVPYWDRDWSTTVPQADGRRRSTSRGRR